MDNSRSFHYTYSVPKQNEILEILKKYGIEAESPDTDCLEELRRLDQEAEKYGNIVSLASGILGVLIFGGGLSMILTGTRVMFIPGILIGLVGIVGIIAAFPLYYRITSIQRRKITPRIREMIDRE